MVYIYILRSTTFSFMDQSKPTFWPNVGRVVIDKLLFRFSICGSVPEIFAIKVESYQKSRKILDDFGPPKFLRAGLPNIVLQFITPASRHVDWKSFMRILPLARKLLSLTRWTNFKFSRLFFGGWGPSSPLRYALASLVNSACKNLRA